MTNSQTETTFKRCDDPPMTRDETRSTFDRIMRTQARSRDLISDFDGLNSIRTTRPIYELQHVGSYVSASDDSSDRFYECRTIAQWQYGDDFQAISGLKG